MPHIIPMTNIALNAIVAIGLLLMTAPVSRKRKRKFISLYMNFLVDLFVFIKFIPEAWH